MTRHRMGLIMAALCLLPVSATSGTVLVVDTETFADTPQRGRATVYLDKSHLRIDSNESGKDYTILYNTDEPERPVYWVIDHGDKSYYEMTKEYMQAAHRRIDDAAKDMEQRLQQMPPGQREQMRKVMKQKMGHLGFVGAKTTYKQVASGIKVGKWACAHYEGTREGSKIEEVWAAPVEELGMNRTELDVFADMVDLFEGVGQDMPAFFSFGRGDPVDENTYDGFPVVVVAYDDGRRREKSELKEIRHEKFAADFFQLPADLKKKSLLDK